MNYTIKTRAIALVICGAIVLLASGCQASAVGTASSQASSASSQASSASTDNTTASTASPLPLANNTIKYSATDTDATWSDAAATAVITLNDTSIAIEGSGAVASGSTLTITAGGLYVVRGTLLNGQIIVTAPATDTVHLVLAGVDITSSTNAAIYETQAKKLIITLADGTQNTLTDAQSYTYADVSAEEPDAALFAKHDLTLNGTGALTVNAAFNNGIGTKDDLLIVSGTYNVTATNHAIRGRDSLTVLDGSFTLSAGNDGLQSNNDEDSTKGMVNLASGTYNITCGGDGIQAETSLYVRGGSYNITSSANPAATVTSFKGLKATTDITITGGEFELNTKDDAVHANGSIAISDGDFTIASGDDAIHADGDLTITSGSINISACYEGLEAATMTLAGGTINIISTDDGINIAGGNDQNAGTFGRDQFVADDNLWILISGGNIVVTAGSDAIDINGNGSMSGGTVALTAATLGEGETLDVNGTWNQTGGDLTESGGGMGGGKGGGIGGMRPRQ